MEEVVFFRSGNLTIEGRYAESGTQKGVVISHPHPQMGGSMWNNVVETLVASFFSKDYSTLRFNFRGVGKSEGTYDDGRGEQQDILAAAKYLSTLNKKSIVLAGYSFGAWATVNLISNHDGFKDAILISPPVLFLEFDFSRCHDKIGLMTCGEQDQFTSLDSLSAVAFTINSRFEIIKGADHFYLGKEQKIAEILDQYL
jgi:alpha/beta superfamily hydrolase